MPVPTSSLGRVLIIAGSDSGGGAGLQADIKTVTVLGGYAATAVTAVTVQNTLGVTGVHPISLDVIEAQARAVLDDIGADVIKTGMLGDGPTADLAGRLISEYDLPAVVDPVMVAKGGARLLAPDAIDAVRRLASVAALLTPNTLEAEALTSLSVESLEDMRRAADALLALGAKAVLMKGGHLAADRVTDILVTAAGEARFEAPRVDTRHTHGTGCTLASACATGLAQGMSLEDAVGRAFDYVQRAIAGAPGLGGGHGPLDHGWPLRVAP